MQSERYTVKKKRTFSFVRFYVMVMLASLMISAYGLRFVRTQERELLIVWSSAYSVPLFGSHLKINTGTPQKGDVILVDNDRAFGRYVSEVSRLRAIVKKGLSYASLGMLFKRRHFGLFTIVALPEERYAYIPQRQSNAYFFSEEQEIDIPEQHYMLANVETSSTNESGYFGPILASSIVGKVIKVVKY